MTILRAARNLTAAARNLAGKWLRTAGRRSRRRAKQASDAAKRTRAQVHRGRADGRDAARRAYSASVKGARTIERWRQDVWSSASLEWSVRRELRAATQGRGPIIVGPWLGEVGYEALYWVAFVRWFADRYHVDPARFVVVSRGGVAGWYRDIGGRYVELLDLFTPAELLEHHARRRAAGDQKQLTSDGFDRAVIARVREHVGEATTVCHPGAMFRLLRRFWLGTDSVQRVLDHTLYRPMSPEPFADCPPLPGSFVAAKFYSGHSLSADPATRATLHALLARVRRGRPIVVLDTGVRVDEHEDYHLDGLPDVHRVAGAMSAQTNLGIQSEIVRRADLFVGTCGGLAWLAPMIGTATLAVYGNDHLLSPHLYAARQIYPRIGAAPFTPLDLAALDRLDIRES